MSLTVPASTRPPLTSASKIWAADRDAHLKDYLAAGGKMGREPPHRFAINDPLLKMLLLPGAPVPSGFPKVPAWTIGKSRAGTLLTWFTRRALDLYRLPFCEDRLLSQNSFREFHERDQLLQIIQALTPVQVDATTREVRALYEHTQIHLKAKGLSAVSLRRHIDDIDQEQLYLSQAESRTHAGEIARLRLAAFALGKTVIQLDMDTLNSYGDDGGYGHKPVHLHRVVPAADVLYSSELVERSSDQESGEWVVINRSVTGVVDFPADDVEVTGMRLDEQTVKAVFVRTNPQDFWQKYQPLNLRPGLNYFSKVSSQNSIVLAKPLKRARSLWKSWMKE